MSPVGTKSRSSPAGDTTLIPPFTRVATHTFPSPSTANESSNWNPEKPYKHADVSTKLISASSPGATMSRCMMRPVQVSAQYSFEPSGDRPMPFGSCAGNTTSRTSEPSALA